MNMTIDATTGDLILEGSNLSLSTEQDEVVQLLRTRLRMFRSEWFLNLGLGVPYYEQILKKNVDANAVDTIFKATIIGTPGIIRLLNFDATVDPVTRALSVAFKAQGINGIIEFEEVIP